MNKINVANIEKLYWGKQLSQAEIAELYGCDKNKICRFMKKNKMKIRNITCRSKLCKFARPLYNKKWSEGTAERMIADYRTEEFGYVELAKKYNLSKDSCQTIIQSRMPKEERLAIFHRRNVKWNSERCKRGEGIAKLFGKPRLDITGDKNPAKKPENRAKIKAHWANPALHKWHSGRIIDGIIKKPTSFEKVIIEVNEKNGLNYEYVGDGQLIINGVNPDFIDKKRNIIIEVYHDYFKIRDFKTTERYERRRRKQLIGYDVRFVNNKQIRSAGKYAHYDEEAILAIINPMGEQETRQGAR